MAGGVAMALKDVDDLKAIVRVTKIDNVPAVSDASEARQQFGSVTPHRSR